MSSIDSMTVEVRTGKNHRLIAPTKRGTEQFANNLGEVVMLVQETRRSGYSPKVVESLEQHCGKRLDFSLLQDLGFDSWAKCVSFVKDDDCIEAALLAHKHVKVEWKLTARTDRDFIDGEDGIGFFDRTLKRLKDAAEKAFDCKYYFKQERPLQCLRDAMGEEVALKFVNYPHPGHWSYPAGHGAKFAASFDAFRDLYYLTSEQEHKLFTFFFVLSCARAGGGVHFMEDNVSSWSLVEGCEVGQYLIEG